MSWGGGAVALLAMLQYHRPTGAIGDGYYSGQDGVEISTSNHTISSSSSTQTVFLFYFLPDREFFASGVF